ncbi:MAG: response regulator transcription factor [Armatimonadetes bacterium]|nr:response regulator transcription factor [Armatimonadota bacterium]
MSECIMIVDDEAALVLGMKVFLEAEGFRTCCAFNGHEAVALLDGTPTLPDLVILDVYMPRLSGWDVLRMIRGSDRTRGLPVIMLTAIADRPVDQARGWDLGCDWYETKPFNMSDLVVVIRRVLDEVRAGPREARPPAAR